MRDLNDWDAIVKEARASHTKQAWLAFTAQHARKLAQSSRAKPLAEIFRLLRTDPHSPSYSPELWAALITGAMNSDDWPLAHEIAKHCRHIASAVVGIPVAQVYCAIGFSSISRATALRCLRLSSNQPFQQLQLRLQIAASYFAEGKREKGLKKIDSLEWQTKKPRLAAHEEAHLSEMLGQIHASAGLYESSHRFHYEAFTLLTALGDDKSAAQNLAHAAAALLRGPPGSIYKALNLLDKLKHLATHHQLPLALCAVENLRGDHSFEVGNYAKSLAHWKIALAQLPRQSALSIRNHTLRKMTQCYLAMGRFAQAKKMAHQIQSKTHRGADSPSHAQERRLNLELLWQQGQIAACLKLMEAKERDLANRGVYTVDDLSALTQIYLKKAVLGHKEPTPNIEVDKILEQSTLYWSTYVYALSQLWTNAGAEVRAQLLLEELHLKAKNTGDLKHQALSLLGQIQLKTKSQSFNDLVHLVRDYELILRKIGETSLKTKAEILRASIAYHAGNFEDCKRTLKQAQKHTHVTFSDRFALQVWIATTEGKSFRLTAPWQAPMIAWYTSTYFAPTLHTLSDTLYTVSGQYMVALDRHQSIALMLRYLMGQSSHSAALQEIQSEVWKQSLRATGWQQKIRNTIMRLRDLFPYTMAPLILHDEVIALFKEAISIQRPLLEGSSTPEEILQILSGSPMSSTELARNLNLSPATIKRFLKRMTESQVVSVIKRGRHIFYCPAQTSAVHQMDSI